MTVSPHDVIRGAKPTIDGIPADHDGTEHGEPERPFGDRYDEALGDGRLSGNLARFQQSWRGNRTDAIAAVDFDELRDRLRDRKAATIADLDGQIARFQSAAEVAGARVHHAATAADANRIVRDLARLHGVDLIAKSKSMVTEEIELNHDFREHGIDVIETDLGEWIVQVMGQRPSHLVMPAIHLGRQQIGDVLTERLGRPISREDIGEQVRVIRDEIREVFFRAGMGITGANALVAESGTVMMCTNEGNGRLTSSVPPVHVVLAGIEKLVPTFDDAVTQLRLLGRSATAQALTSYTTFITGPTPGHEMHIVLVDNGRRRMADLPEFSEALHCIRCGACSNVCPPYREVGGHVFGHIYTGAIGLVVTPFLGGETGLDDIAGPQSLCVSCNACATVCPVGIPLPRQILDVRRMVVRKKGLHPAKRAAFAVLSRRRIFDAASRVGAVAQLPVTRGGPFIRTKAPILNRQTRWRSLPALARRPLRDRVRVGEVLPVEAAVVPNGAAGKTVAVFPGCITDRLYPEQGQAVTDTLRHLGARVVYPAGLGCCGLPSSNSGDEAGALRMARQTIRALERTRADVIVSGSASCVAMIAQDYVHLFRDDPAWLVRAEGVARRVMDFTTFLTTVAKLPAGSLVASQPSGLVPDGTVTYHDSCQALNALGVSAEPRRLIADVLGYRIAELAESSLCCGFGGSFSFEHPRVAERLLRRKLEDADATGARVLVTDNQGCIMHIRGGADASGRPLRVVHIAELLAERLRSRRAAR